MDGEISEEEKNQHDPRVHHQQKYLRVFFAVTFFLAATLICAKVLRTAFRPTVAHMGDNAELRIDDECGTSPFDARNQGCVFDVIIMGWVPWRCYDAELASEFLERDDWTFYHDTNGTRTVTKEEITQGEWTEFYSDYHYQVIHCMFAWKKTQRAATRGSLLDGYLADPHHTNHCEMSILHGNLADKIAYMKYVICPHFHVSRDRFGWYRAVGDRKVYRTP